MRALLLLVTVATALALAPPTALGAVGDLTFVGCDSDDGSEASCTDVPEAPLKGTRGVAVSPDGSDVYAVGNDADSLVHFRAGPDGDLEFADCATDNGAQGCVDIPGAPLDGAFAVAVSPDGNSVYVASSLRSALVHFVVNAAGTPVYSSCLSNDGTGGPPGSPCTDLPGEPLTQAEDLVVSPDGKSVYIAARNASSVSHFTANAAGQPAWAGCIANPSAAHDCTDLPPGVVALDQASGIDVSPNGSSVYAAGRATLVHLRTNATGQLSYGGCVADPGFAWGCATTLPGKVLDFGTSVAVSPDGAFVYTTGRDANAVARFATTAGGSPTFSDCVSADGVAPCSDAPGRPLAAALSVDMSPDGSSVYVASFFGNTITHLLPTATGGLDFGSCIARVPNEGCPGPGVPALFGAHDTAVSPDGDSVYVVSLDDAVIHFRREGAAPPPPPADTDPPNLTIAAKKVEAGKPIAVEASCDELCTVALTGSAKPKGAKRGSLKPASAELAAGQEAMLKLKPKRKLKRGLKAAGKGKAKIAATATDPAGNTADATDRVKLK